MNYLSLTFIQHEIMKELASAMDKFEIDTPLRAAHFLSQCKHESMNFTKTIENINYSAEGLKNVFKKYFPDDDTAKAYERLPEKIANRVYANRMGNGDENSGDGWKYRGRGYIQLTGKNNYTSFSKAIGENIDAEIMSTPAYASLSAAW